MRVTFVLPYANLTGGIRIAATHATSLHALGHAVTVVSVPLPPATLVGRVRAMLRGEAVPPSVPKRTYFDGRPVPHRILESARPVTDADVPDADVVIATWWETAEWTARMSPSKGAKVLFIQGYELSGRSTDARLEATWRLPMHKIVVSSWLRDIAHTRFGDSTTSLVPNPVDTTIFSSPPRSKRPTPTVGLVYARDPCKGPDVLARAARAAVTRVPGLRVMAFGWEPKRQSDGLPAGTVFERSPSPARIVEMYSSCDAWLFGSRAEGFGLPILEAMACRTPVIATPAGAAPELLRGGGGYLVGAEDAEGMASRVGQIVGMNDTEWRAMSECARATAQRHTVAASAAQFEAALELAVSRAHRGEISGGDGAKSVASGLAVVQR